MNLIPEKLKVGTAEWTVEFVSDLESQSDDDGRTIFKQHRILIDAGLPKERQLHTFFHELLHVCADFAGIQDEKWGDEEIASRLSGILYTTLKESGII